MKFIEIPIQTVTRTTESLEDEITEVAYCTMDIDEVAAFYDSGGTTTILFKTGDSLVSEYNYRQFKESINNLIKIN